MPLKKSLNVENTLIHIKHYPSLNSRRGGKRVLLGMGGNVGDVLRRFEHIFQYFKHSVYLNIIKTAPILKNPAFGYTQQKDFYNTLLEIETKLSPKALLSYLLRVEKHFGRKRSFPNAPRTLDIDMIFYENIQMQTTFLTLPHPVWFERNSVLIPLSYMQGR